MKFNVVRRLGNIKIGRRLGLSFAVIVILLTSVLAAVQYRSFQTVQVSATIADDEVAKLEDLAVMENAVHTVSRAIRSMMLFKDDPAHAESERKKLTESRAAYERGYAHLLTKKISPEGMKLVDQFYAARKTSAQLNDKVLALLEEKRFDEALVALSAARPAVEAEQALLRQYGDRQHDRAEQAAAEVAASNRLSLKIDIAATITATLLAAGLAFAIARSVTQPLNALQGAIQSVRDGGSMNALAEVQSKDELADMGFAVNQLLVDQIAQREKAEEERAKAEAENERLNNSVISILQAVNQLSQRDLTARAPVTQDMIGTVSDSINALTDETAKVLSGVNMIAAQVAEASNKVKDQGDLVSKTADDERQNVAHMIESLADATETMNQVAVLAAQSNKSAEQATTATDNALETVQGTVKGMESIRETIAETEKRIKRLGERSQEITGIVNLINTISERTHVLALNASMQAAVAGEAGRGFAVVAEEVQRLAESSRNATQQIGTLVNNIQLETNETISTVNRTIGQVVQGSEQAQKAGEQMRRTQQITSELVAQVRRIGDASDQQKVMSAGLLKSVQHIGDSTQRTSQQITTQNRETETLLDSAKRLVASVAVFKLPQAA